MKKMQKIRNAIVLNCLLWLCHVGLGQTAPNSVCTIPETYTYDQTVTWRFDLTGNTMVTPGQSLYFWSWTPKQLPGGAALMKYEKEMTWSLTFIPTALYGATVQEIQAAGNSAFWCNIRNASGTSVTGTIPFAQKEKLRLGFKCLCSGTPVTQNNNYYINFGSSTVANPSAYGAYWNNVVNPGTAYTIVDTANVARYGITTSSDFIKHNDAGFPNPNYSLLGNMAISNATNSMFYTTACNKIVTLSCLNPSSKYKFYLFGTRNTGLTRKTRYTFYGASNKQGVLQTSGTGISTASGLYTNDDQFYVAEVYPTAAGVITLDVSVEDGGYAYLNLMKIEETVNSNPIAITGISINTPIASNGPSKLQTTFSPANTTQKEVNWSVSDPTIAIIDFDGNIKPIKEGTVTVTATSGFNTNIKDQKVINFSNLQKNFYFGGTATEAGSDGASNALSMRLMNYQDSTYSGIFELYTSIGSTGTIKFYSAKDGSAIEYGTDGNGKLVAGGSPITTSAGWKQILVNLNTMAFTISNVQGWTAYSNIIALDANQTGWWGGDEDLTTYEGNGVWSKTINFSRLSPASDNPRLYVKQKGTSRTLKWVDNTKDKLFFEDMISYGTCSAYPMVLDNIYVFNGEYKVSIDMNKYTYKIEHSCASVDTNKIVFIGSSVCKGYGSDPAVEDPSAYLGYAYQYKKQLESRAQQNLGRNWNYANVAIGGNTTQDVLNRMDRDLWTQCGKYAVVGLSMANEGLLTGGQQTFGIFQTNMHKIIDSIRAHNMTPLVMGNYANMAFNATHYSLIKQMNLDIHQWDVPSVNLLGALEDGNGKFVTGYTTDPAHPNKNGYTEFLYAMPPSMFEAIAANKPLPVKMNGTYLSFNKSLENFVLTFKPEETIHSFTYSFDIKTQSTGIISTFAAQTDTCRFEISSTGALVFHSSESAGITGTTIVNDGTWHKITLSHYYAFGKTLLYVDGVLIGSVSEKLLPRYFTISHRYGPTADYREVYFYRSGMNAEEISALASGLMLKSSLEIYAPLDQQNISGKGVWYNYATSMNVLSKTQYQTQNVFIEAENYYLAMDAQVVPCNDGGQMVTDYSGGEWIVWAVNLPITGSYRVEYRVASEFGNTNIRFEKAGGSPIYGYANVPSTGGNDQWTTISHTVNLEAGAQYVAIYSATGGFNINWINIVPISPYVRIVDEILENTIQVAPNPVIDRTQLLGVSESATWEIIDIQGKLVMTGNGIALNLDLIQSGYYLIKIMDSDKQIVKEIIKY